MLLFNTKQTLKAFENFNKKKAASFRLKLFSMLYKKNISNKGSSYGAYFIGFSFLIVWIVCILDISNILNLSPMSIFLSLLIIFISTFSFIFSYKLRRFLANGFKHIFNIKFTEKENIILFSSNNSNYNVFFSLLNNLKNKHHVICLFQNDLLQLIDEFNIREENSLFLKFILPTIIEFFKNQEITKEELISLTNSYTDKLQITEKRTLEISLKKIKEVIEKYDLKNNSLNEFKNELNNLNSSFTCETLGNKLPSFLKTR